MNVVIEKADIVGAQKIRLLENKAHGTEVSSKYDIPMLVHFGYMLVAKINNTIVGAILGYKTRDNEIYVCDWVVDPDYQRKGIGLQLYKEFIKETKGHDLITLILTSNKTSFQAHQKLGFTFVRDVKDPFQIQGEDGVWMRLRNK